jgi:hypothetical protein
MAPHLPGSPKDRSIATKDKGNIGATLRNVLFLRKVEYDHFAMFAQ